MMSQGHKPLYVEDARIRKVLDDEHEQKPDKSLGFVPQALKDAEYHSHITDEQLEYLSQMGFSNKAIEEAVKDEIQHDIKKVLQNPGLVMSELRSAKALETAYKGWKLKRPSAAATISAGVGPQMNTVRQSLLRRETMSISNALPQTPGSPELQFTEKPEPPPIRHSARVQELASTNNHFIYNNRDITTNKR